MVKFWNFYLKESLCDIKRDWVVLICIAFSISMFSGLAYFNDANQKLNFHESLRYFSDFEIVHDQTYNSDFGETTTVDFIEKFKETDKSVFEVCENSDLDITNIFKFGMVRLEEGNIVSESWKSIDQKKYNDGFTYRIDMNASKMNFGFFGETFFNSERFSTYFKQIEGKTPSKPNEIMIDVSFATKYNVGVGETTNITLIIGRTMNKSPLIVNLNEIIIENLTITGIYLPIQKEYDIDLNHFEYTYDYFDYLNNKTYEIPEVLIEEPLIFCYDDFSEGQNDNFLKELHAKILNKPEISQFKNSLRTFSGYILTYERSNIEYQKIRWWRTYLSTKSYEVYLNLPIEVGYIDRLTYNLKYLMSEYSKNRIFLQFLNYPIIIFSILINQNLKKRDEFEINKKIMNFRSKGMQKRVILNQELIFILFNGIFASLSGLLLGGLTFYGYSKILGNLYSSVNSLAQLPLISSTTIILSLILGICISFLSNLKGIQRIKKSNYSKLINTINMSKNGDYNSSTPSRQENLEKEKDFPIFLIIKIVLGVIPILLYYLLYISKITKLSDTLIDIAIILSNSTNLLLILGFIGLGFLISGLIQILAIEKTQTYQHYSQLFSRFFIKDLNPIVTQNLISNKKWSKILTYLTLFIAYVVSMNLFFYTQLNIENLISNYQEGTSILSYFHDPLIADLQGDFSLEFGKSGFFKMLYIDFLIIGIFLAIELAMNIIIIAQENHYLTQNLIKRGISRRKLLQMLITQTAIIFSIASIIGICSGLLFGVGINKITSFLLIRSSAIIFPSEMSYPIFFEFWSVLGLIAAIFVTVCTVLVINYVGKYRDRVKLESSSEGLMAQSD